MYPHWCGGEWDTYPPFLHHFLKGIYSTYLGRSSKVLQLSNLNLSEGVYFDSSSDTFLMLWLFAFYLGGGGW